MSPEQRTLVAASNLIVNRDSLLLVREAKREAHGRYSLPAGKVEPGETIGEAAVREAREETGLTVEVLALVGIYHCPVTSEGTAVVNHVFESRVADGVIAPTEAHPEVRFVPFSELEELASAHRLRGTHVLRALHALRTGRRLPLDLVEVVPASPLPD